MINRSRLMKAAHADWRAVKHRPGASFSRCLKAAWRAERERNGWREFYNPDPTRPSPEMMIAFEAVGAQMRALAQTSRLDAR